MKVLYRENSHTLFVGFDIIYNFYHFTKSNFYDSRKELHGDADFKKGL